MTENLPPEMPNSETFKDMHTQVEAFLSTNVSESHSSLPADVVYDQRNQTNESTNKQFQRMDNHLDAAGVRDISHNGEDTPHNRNRSSDIRETIHLPSSESSSRSPKPPKNEGQREVIEQFEPGVYVTLVQLPNGTKIFKRVRFSKRRFAEQQAEEWWMENKDRLLKKYSLPVANSGPTGSSVTPTPSEENNEVTSSS
ncbi:Protein Brevis radix-like [Actinidia chinensis var. chinensis]|uniref:Protein Brevis radix-like n=1 Tax=Actinidia chinensis var. chinensis TaxID=1590841 RepID=A0A2R6PW36_ACTCC|nr:Protein Brevis radix-like [Actinidia chinensis var. chinensis]